MWAISIFEPSRHWLPKYPGPWMMSEVLKFENYLAAIEELMLDLGVVGIFSSSDEVRRIEKLYDAGAPLEVVLRGILLGAERRVKKGNEVRGVKDVLRTVNAELRRSGLYGEAP